VGSLVAANLGSRRKTFQKGIDMQIYEALKKDHDKVKQLLADLLALDDENDEARGALVEQIRDELIPHSRAEESVFYNSLRAVDATKSLAMHGYKEHLEAEGHLRMLQIKDRTDMDWKDTAQKLQESLLHHILEEETIMFEMAKEVLTSEEAEMMTEAFERLKPEIKEEGIVKNTWDMMANLMPKRFKRPFAELHKK
jgi:hemerythrin superfamily protein